MTPDPPGPQHGPGDCLHCGGSGVEPFSDDEKCAICLGEQTIPAEMNREYYEAVREALDDV